MKTKFFFFLAMLLMSSVGAFAQSESKTPLKGDVNEDGIVDAADVVEVVNIIMKKDVDPNKYYWYIGVDNPSSISNIQTDNTVPGWHEIGSSLSGFVLDTNDEANEVILDNNPVYYNYYVIIPDELGIYDFFGFNLINDGSFNEVSCNIQGYKAYQYVYGQARTASGIIIKQ